MCSYATAKSQSTPSVLENNLAYLGKGFSTRFLYLLHRTFLQLSKFLVGTKHSMFLFSMPSFVIGHTHAWH